MQDFKKELELRILEHQQSGKDEIMVDIDTGESWADCNDMGIMQALDIIGMLMWFIKEILEQGIVFNTEKIIAYGSSHGYYLSY